MRQDQALTYGLNVWTQRELYTTENSNFFFFSMSGECKKKDKMLTHQNKRISQFQQRNLSYVGVCVYHILSPNILKPPPKKRQIYPPKTLSKMERKPKHLTYLASLACVP